MTEEFHRSAIDVHGKIGRLLSHPAIKSEYLQLDGAEPVWTEKTDEALIFDTYEEACNRASELKEAYDRHERNLCQLEDREFRKISYFGIVAGRRERQREPAWRATEPITHRPPATHPTPRRSSTFRSAKEEMEENDLREYEEKVND